MILDQIKNMVFHRIQIMVFPKPKKISDSHYFLKFMHGAKYDTTKSSTNGVVLLAISMLRVMHYNIISYYDFLRTFTNCSDRTINTQRFSYIHFTLDVPRYITHRAALSQPRCTESFQCHTIWLG